VPQSAAQSKSYNPLTHVVIKTSNDQWWEGDARRELSMAVPQVLSSQLASAPLKYAAPPSHSKSGAGKA
jgi:hypothetical protein